MFHKTKISETIALAHASGYFTRWQVGQDASVHAVSEDGVIRNVGGMRITGSGEVHGKVDVHDE